MACDVKKAIPDKKYFYNFILEKYNINYFSWRLIVGDDKFSRSVYFCFVFFFRKLSMGPQTEEVPLILFFENRNRLVRKLQEINKNSFVLLQGGTEVSFYDTDTTYNIFRQVSSLSNWVQFKLIFFFFITYFHKIVQINQYKSITKNCLFWFRSSCFASVLLYFQ